MALSTASKNALSIAAASSVAGAEIATAINTSQPKTALDGLTAHAGGGQAAALLITTDFTRVTTVGTAADSLRLPPATVGVRLTVINAAAANSMNVFPASGESINALANDTALACTAASVTDFICAKTGKWHSK